jgi:PhnB protein
LGGNCQEAFRFYERRLGDKITMMLTHADAPALIPTPPGWEKAILHARISIGDTELYANEVPPEHFQPIRSIYLYLTLDTTEEAERVHTLLAEGGQVFMPMQETFFAPRFSLLRDRFRTSWTILREHPMPPS